MLEESDLKFKGYGMYQNIDNIYRDVLETLLDFAFLYILMFYGTTKG
jgi:hypothetical protein